MTSFFHAQRVCTEVTERGSIVLALDGKTVRGTIPAGHTRGLHLLAVYLPDTGVVFAQASVDQKANEIVAAPHCWPASR